MDFDPTGKFIVTLSITNELILSEVDSNKRLSSQKLGDVSIGTLRIILCCCSNYEIGYQRCRWNPQNSIIAVSFNLQLLNFIDVETGSKMFKENPKLHPTCIKTG